MATPNNAFLACGGREFIAGNNLACDDNAAADSRGGNLLQSQIVYPNCTNASSAVNQQLPSLCTPSGDCMLTPVRDYWGWNASENGASPATSARVSAADGALVPLSSNEGYRACACCVSTGAAHTKSLVTQRTRDP